jgi:hypothetical protein
MIADDHAELRKRLEPMLLAIAEDRTGVALRELRPCDADYVLAFAPAVLGPARLRYEALWTGPLDFRHPDPEALVEIELGVADRDDLFVTGRVWASWRYVAPGRTAGLFYDGLAGCDDHWAWFPKPYRLLRG